MAESTVTQRENRSGRDESTGRFLHGNPGGPGNPDGPRVAKLRSALLECISPEDVAELGRVLLKAALAGDTASARLLLDRLLGKTRDGEALEKLEQKEYMASLPEEEVVELLTLASDRRRVEFLAGGPF